MKNVTVYHFMAKENEQQVDETQEDIEETQDGTQEDQSTEEEEVNWEARAKELEQKAIKQRENTKELKAKLKELESKIPEEKEDKPNGSDSSNKALEIAQRALLNSSGYTNAEQQDYIFKAAEKYKVDVSEIVNDDFHKSKLKAIADKIAVQGSMPKGGGKGGSEISDSVDYWIAKDELPPDQELAEKVVEAKIKKAENKGQFSDTLYVG